MDALETLSDCLFAVFVSLGLVPRDAASYCLADTGECHRHQPF